MDLSKDQIDARVDLRLGKIALRKGLLTPGQLQEALAEQGQGLARGRRKPRRLGAILAAKKFLTDAQVFSLLEEQEARVLTENRSRGDDLLMGRILVDGGLARAEHVEECLKIQARALEHSAEDIPLLGDLLVQKGFARREDIDQALELQKEVVLVCAGCGYRWSGRGMDPEMPESCPACRGPLEPPEESPAKAPAVPASSLPATAPAPVTAPSPPQELPRQARAEESEPLRAMGKYILRRKLGHGSMGEVYEAKDTQLGRTVALKVLRRVVTEGREESPNEVKRFLREAQLAAKIRHPNVVGIYETDVADDHHYIAMEFVQGQTMAAWRKASGAPLRQQVKVLRDVCLAVHHAHECGVLHRDLKPQNVLVDESGRAFVTDFGLAKAVNPGGAERDASSMICGTAAYMSPEQALGLKEIDCRADVYSLAAMLYEILSGRPPLLGKTREETLEKIKADTVAPPGGVGRSRGFTTMDSEIERICTRALSKSPADRPPTAKALADELTKWLDRKEASIPKPRAIPREVWIGGSLAAAGILVALVILMRPRAPESDPALQRAQQFLQGGDARSAFALYEQILRRNPGHAKAREGRESARALLMKDALADVDRARTELEKARAEQDRLKTVKAGTLDEDAQLVEQRRNAERRVKESEERLQKALDHIKTVSDYGVAPPK